MTGGGAQTPLRGPVGAGVGLSAPNIGLVPRRDPTTGGAAGVHSSMRSRAWQDEFESNRRSSRGEELAGPGWQVRPDGTNGRNGMGVAGAVCAFSSDLCSRRVARAGSNLLSHLLRRRNLRRPRCRIRAMDPPPINKPPIPLLPFSSSPPFLPILRSLLECRRLPACSFQIPCVDLCPCFRA